MTQVNESKATETQATLANTVAHFGQILGHRIYATALILSDKRECPIEDATRIVIGSLKAMKQRATKPMSYSAALDAFDMELDEGRHYSVESALTREVKEIEFRNDHRKEWLAGQRVVQAVEAQQAAQDEAPDVLLAVKEWIAAFQAEASESPKRAAFIRLVMGKYARGVDISTREQALLRQRYMPRGIGYSDFLEVLTRYAKA